MRWENIRDFIGLPRSSKAWVNDIAPRPLSEREISWIQDILQVSEGWADADLTQTRVTAEGQSADEGRIIVLKADQPQNPKRSTERPSVGNLWIQTSDGNTINVQLSQSNGCLTEVYVLFVGPKRSERRLPDTWAETSRDVVGLSR